MRKEDAAHGRSLHPHIDMLSQICYYRFPSVPSPCCHICFSQHCARASPTCFPDALSCDPSLSPPAVRAKHRSGGAYDFLQLTRIETHPSRRPSSDARSKASDFDIECIGPDSTHPVHARVLHCSNTRPSLSEIDAWIRRHPRLVTESSARRLGTLLAGLRASYGLVAGGGGAAVAGGAAGGAGAAVAGGEQAGVGGEAGMST